MKFAATNTTAPAIIMASGIGDMILGYVCTIVDAKSLDCKPDQFACFGSLYVVGVIMMLAGGTVALVAGAVLLKRLLVDKKLDR